jgi:hypothetical protein
MFIEELGKSDTVTEEELDMIAYRNAEKLLKFNEGLKKGG